MPILVVVIVVLVIALIVPALSLRIVTQYEQGVLFRLGRVLGVRPAGLTRGGHRAAGQSDAGPDRTVQRRPA